MRGSTAMQRRFVCRAALMVAAALAAGPALAASWSLPEDHRSLTRTISFAEMESFLKSIDGTANVQKMVIASQL